MKYHFKDTNCTSFTSSDEEFSVRSLRAGPYGVLVTLQRITPDIGNKLFTESITIQTGEVNNVLDMLLGALTDETIVEIANQRAKVNRFVCRVKTGNKNWPDEEVS